MRWIWIDKFTEFESGVRAVALKSITLAEEYLHDHFPGYPLVPASLLLEGMAQTGGILVGQARDFQEKVILAKISRAVFHEEILPGSTIAFHAHVESLGEEAASIRGEIQREGAVVAQIELMYSHIDQNLGGLEFPQENFVFNDQFMSLLRSYLPDEHRV